MSYGHDRGSLHLDSDAGRFRASSNAGSQAVVAEDSVDGKEGSTVDRLRRRGERRLGGGGGGRGLER